MTNKTDEKDYTNLIMPRRVSEEEAEKMGAFIEEALSYEDAIASIEDEENEYA